MHPTSRITRAGQAGALALAVALAVPLLATAPAPATAQAASVDVVAEEVTNRGTDFWFAFPQNADFARTTATPTLFVSGESGTTVTVSIPGLMVSGEAFSEESTIGTDGLVSFDLPAAVQVTEQDGIEALGINVTASAPVAVYALNLATNTSDAFLAFPTAALGTEYRVLTHTVTSNQPDGTGTLLGAAGFTIVAAEDDTTVTITPSVTVGSRTDGVPFDVKLEAGEVYQLKSEELSATSFNGADLSGSLVTSDRPVAVLGFAECSIIHVDSPPLAGDCDTVVQQIPATDFWATSFAVPMLEPRTASTVRIMAAVDDTEVIVSGEVPVTIDAGEFYELKPTTSILITTSDPVLVAQYAHGNKEDFGPANIGDPLMMLIPGVEQFLDAYTIATAGAHYQVHRVNIVTTTEGIDGITWNGDDVASSAFQQIGGTRSRLWGATLVIPHGTHTFEGTETFGLFVYGWTGPESYGYPGGTAFRFTGFTGITISSVYADSSERCITATLAAPADVDRESFPVIWTITGANPQSVFADTDADGASELCYTPSAAGTDTISATAGTVRTAFDLTIVPDPDPEPVAGDTTTAAPGDTTTAAPGDTTTAAPGDTCPPTTASDKSGEAGGGPIPTVVPAGQGSPDRRLLGLALALAAGGLAAGARAARSTIRG